MKLGSLSANYLMCISTQGMAWSISQVCQVAKSKSGVTEEAIGEGYNS